MLHLVLYGLLAVILAGGLFLVASRFLPAGEQIAPPLRDEPPWELPADRTLHPEDIDTMRLPVALRGYRFAETDILLDRLAGELRARDEEIARLRGHAPGEPARAEPAVSDAGHAPVDLVKEFARAPVSLVKALVLEAERSDDMVGAEGSKGTRSEQTGGDDRP